MLNNRELNQKEFFLFIIIAIGLPFFVAIPWWIAFVSGIDFLATSSVVTPAFGVILAKYICEKENPLLPKWLYFSFILFAGGAVIIDFTGFLLAKNGISNLNDEASIYILVGTLLFIIASFLEKEEKRYAYGLSGQNWKKSFWLIIIFTFLSVLANIVRVVLSGHTTIHDITDTVTQNFVENNVNIAVFQFVFIRFLSAFLEEYGWRYYLQPLFLKKYGVLGGILLVGILWEVWHLPSVLLIFSQEENVSLITLLLARFINTIILAFVIGYIYFKTNNLWAAIIVHAVNNILIILFDDISDGLIGLYYILIRVVVFLPFVILFSREYKKQVTLTES